MALRKCPKCELNYIKDGAEFCDVCLREMKRIAARDHSDDDERPANGEVFMCSECGEAPAVKGSELCVNCLKEHKRQIELENAAMIDEEFEAVVAADGDDDEEQVEEE